MKNYIAWLMILIGSNVAYAQSDILGVIGQDNRRILQSDEFSSKAIGSAIGRVNVAGYNRASLCTGTLIAPDKVVTASHCLFNPRTKRQAPTNTIHFVAGKRGDAFEAHSKISEVFLLPNYSYSQKRTTAFLATDVAVLKLVAPLTIPPIMIPTKPKHDPTLAHVLYSRDRPHLPAIHAGCGIKRKTHALWATDCDTNFGGSGGPLLIEQDGAMKIAAVMVGIAPGKASFAVPAAIWLPLLHQ